MAAVRGKGEHFEGNLTVNAKSLTSFSVWFAEK